MVGSISGPAISTTITIPPRARSVAQMEPLVRQRPSYRLRSHEFTFLLPPSVRFLFQGKKNQVCQLPRLRLPAQVFQISDQDAIGFSVHTARAREPLRAGYDYLFCPRSCPCFSPDIISGSGVTLPFSRMDNAFFLSSLSAVPPATSAAARLMPFQAILRS